MPVKVSLSRLKSLLQACLADRSKALITPARYQFREDGVLLAQASADKIVAVYATFEPKYFDDYEPIGDIVLAPENLLGIVSDLFKYQAMITIEKKGEELVLRGDTVKYTEPLLSMPEEDFNPVTKTYEEIVYPVREGFDLRGLYQVDMSYFKTAKKKWESVMFEYSPVGIRYTLELGAGRVEMSLPGRAVVKPSATYRFRLRAEFLKYLSNVFPGMGYFGVVASEDGELGPLVFSGKGDGYVLNYWIVPEVVE